MTDPSDTSRHAAPDETGPVKVDCGDLQALLFDYMNRELGAPRSDLIREHLRRCATCQARAAGIQDTLDLLHDASRAGGRVPDRLSEKHHARLTRALMHPVLDWTYRNHILVSAAVAAVVVLLTFFGLRQYRIWKARPGPGIPVTIGEGNDAEQ